MKRKVSDILTHNLTTITLEDTLMHAAKLMSDKHISCIIAVTEGKPVGILTEADLVHIGHLDIDMQHTTVAKHVSQVVMTIDAEDNLYEAFECMLQHHVRHLVTVNTDGLLQGLLTFTDILNAAEFDDFMKSKLICDEMSHNLAVLSPSDSLQHAFKRMDEQHISCVVLAEDNKAVGVFSERDVVNLIASGKDLSSLIMSDVMSSPLITMKQNQSLLEASQLMHQHHFRRIVIVDDEQAPIGILTQFDVVRGLENKRMMDLKKMFSQTKAALNEAKALLAVKNELEQRYRSLFEESRDMMHIIDVDGRIIDVNQAELNTLGYSREEMIGKPVSEIICRTCQDDSVVRMMQGETTGLSNSALLTKDGKCIHVEVSATPQFKNGKVVAGRAIIHDITERKRSKTLLKRRERQLAILAEAGRTIHETLDETHITRKLVDFACRLVACKSGAVGLYRHESFIFSEYATGGHYQPIDYAFPSGYGIPGHVLDTRQPYISNDAIHDPHVIPEIQQALGFKKLINVPILDAHGKLLACFEIHDRLDGADFDAQDLEMLLSLSGIVSAALTNARLLATSQQQQQQMLLLQSAIAAVNESIIITDSEGTIVYVNPAFIRNTGYSTDYAIGKTPAILNSKQQSTTFYQHFWQTLKEGNPWSGRILDRHKNGTIFPVHLSVAPIFNEHGEISHYVAVHEDLSASEAMQKKMMQTQKMEAVGIMAGGMAHDFNNLLATLTGNLYLMRSHHKDNEEIVKRSKNMDVSIQHGAKMIQQMLTFARKNSITMHNIDLQSFIKEAHKMAQAALPEDIKLTLNYDGVSAWIHGDPSQLQQVILNLVANACHAIKDSNNPHIHLELDHQEPSESLLLNHAELITDHGWCCIRCQDNGSGISSGNLEHIFEPFFTTREVGMGTGLGLAMVYGAVQSHRGIIDVQSAEGEGTTFSIYLPLHKTGQVDVIDHKDYMIKGNNRGILVVDDNEQLREILVHVLRYNGFTVWEAADGELALSQYRKFKDKLSLVLMDIVMPNMGGIAAAQEIRAINEQLPIIFLTGYGEEAQLHAASSIQHSSALSKPIAMSDLIKTIEKHLMT